jgi:hypothetical protein
MSMSATRVALPDQVVVLFHSQRSQLFPSAPTTPQFHSPPKFLMPVQLMLDVITVCAALV